MKQEHPSEYNHILIEKKWRDAWSKSGIYRSEEKSQSKKFYVLDMFPYPSGEGLHVGHPKGYIATDIISRHKRMEGYSVLHPMGFDAFGLPAENYALKTKTNPKIAVAKNVARYKEQLEIIGFDYDWTREINTTDPKYYHWTQWIFLQLYKKGLAYESHEPINWCPSCKTGLANEDVEDGKCERCGTTVEKKPLRQWVLKITDYAERLLKDLDTQNLDWPQSIIELQKNWIGKSEGVNFICKVKDLDITVKMYNSVPQAYRAETFTVIAPEHPLVEQLIAGTPQESDVRSFVEKIKAKKASQKFNIDEDIEGIFTGRYIENFAGTGRDLPIWIASYVVADYGTGIVNCSAHDVRDFAFAQKYTIPLKQVLSDKDGKLPDDKPLVREGYLLEPQEFKGREWNNVRSEIIEYLVSQGFAEKTINYKIRDWVFARQRYWGEPIPLIHCEKCGVVPVPEADLPVMLPDVEHYEPTGTGESPLAGIESWVHVSCPQCKGNARRETNTMPQWAGSSWYYLRYMDPHNTKALISSQNEKYWAPVDVYVGGAEHATRHLIYARFWHKFLYDIGIVSTLEPFKKLQHVGLIMAEDGRKMSKRYGNVVNPDDVIATYGADTFRVYEMFMGPFDQSAMWSTNNIIGTRRFIEKVWRIYSKVGNNVEVPHKRQQLLAQTIKKVGDDIPNFRFNTAISSLMILANEFDGAKEIAQSEYEILLKLLAPFAPHITEELWSKLGNTSLIHTQKWPEFDPKLCEVTEYTLGVQVNGKVRASLQLNRDMSEDTVKKIVLEHADVQKWVGNSEIKKFVYIPGKIVSIVI